MTVEQMIKELLKLEKQYGKTIEIFFDCPKCVIAYRPKILIAQAIHIKSDEEQ